MDSLISFLLRFTRRANEAGTSGEQMLGWLTAFLALALDARRVGWIPL